MKDAEIGASPDVAKALRISGRGYECGCLIPDDIPKTAAEAVVGIFARDPRNLIRTAPSWVPVKLPKPGVDPNKVDFAPEDLQAVEEPQELEGVLLRSYQTWTDFPMLQWHRWYDWNFMVFPAPGYGYLRGGANKTPPVAPNDPDTRIGFNQMLVRDLDGTDTETMECEFDCGLFGSRFREKGSPKSYGPMFEADWAWPMVGQYLWARGTWVYDCGHPTDPEPPPKNPQDVKRGPKAGLMRSELHPCRSIATARWEAVNFPENGKLFVPAIQFMFFATRLGGYTDDEVPAEFPRQDIEFIVDLPKHETHPGPFPIGHTPKFPHNTIQLPQLLTAVDFEPFKAAIKKTDSATTRRFLDDEPLVSHDVPPIIEPIRRKDDPNAPPQQVKVTIPFDTRKKRPQGEKSIPQDDDFYGFILSMGWLDTDLSQARRVKLVEVKIDKIKVALDDHGFLKHGSRSWQVRAGVNGRWIQAFQEGVRVGSDIVFKDESGAVAKPFTFALADDDEVLVAAHGEETDAVHDIVYRARDDKGRVLMMPTGPFRKDRKLLYVSDCLREDHALARTIVSQMESDMIRTGANESLPIGRIDPFHRVLRDGALGPVHPADSENPMPIAKVNGKVGLHLSGLASKEVGHLSELAERPVKDPLIGIEYLLLYSIEAKPQIQDT